MRRPTLENQLAPFEVIPDRELQIGHPLIARLIGRKFDQLLDSGSFAAPFDAQFAKAMVKTLSYLCTVLGASFGFAERTELSLYAVANGGDARRLLSRIAGEASAKFSLLIGQVATFEARLYAFPQLDLPIEYFRWRQEQASGVAADRYCIHMLGQSGADASAVPRILDGLGFEEKVELLREKSLDFQTLPSWQRRGAMVRLVSAEPDGHPRGPSGKLMVDLDPPSGDEFSALLRASLAPPKG